MSQPIYKGNCDNQVQAEGATTIGDAVTRTVIIKGKKTTLQALQNTTYLPGATYEAIWTVSSTTLTDLPGYMAKLTLNLTIQGTSTGEIPNPVSTIPVWEINWTSVDKPLLTVEKAFGQYTGSENAAQREIIVDEVLAWKDSPQNRKRKYQIPATGLTGEARPENDADWVDLSAEAKNIAKKMAKGIEAKLVFSPVITKTEVYGVRPTTGACGTINTPVVNIAGYVYLKNGDRAVQQQDKTWTRTESWQGADEWDTDLYETT